MTKRIVSGVFILMALGALGVILAGALSSGEQLIVRFLTAVIVAALGLYVISDLRLQADDETVSPANPLSPRMAMAEAPANSTAAFMATVTQREGAGVQRESAAAVANSPQPALRLQHQAGDERTETPDRDLGTAPSSTTEPASAVVEGAGSPPPTEQSRVQGPDTVVVSDLADLGLPLSPTKIDKPTSETDAFAWPSAPAQPEAPKVATSATATEAKVTTAQAGAPLPAEPQQLAEQPAAKTSNTVGAVPKEPDGYRVELTPAHGVGGGDTSSSPSGPGRKRVNGHRFDHQQIDVALAGEPAPTSPPTKINPRTVVDAADYADAPLAPIIDLRGPATIETDIERAIASGEVEVVAKLIEQGMLSTDGPISDREVRTMVYVAFTSNELRKLLRAGGHPDTPTNGVDLGPVELFDSRFHRPTPKTLYSGTAEQLEPQSQLG